jgi:hypothetical protein
MRVLFIGDVHERVEEVKKALTISADKYIFTGDYFDSHEHSNLKQTEEICYLVKQLLNRNDTVLLMGNHDLSYRSDGNFACSGFTMEKCNLINSIITPELWSEMSYWYYIYLEEQKQEWLVSHAGFHRDLFTCPINGESLEFIMKRMKDSEIRLTSLDMTNEFGAGRARGGMYLYGGILWCDFDREFKPLKSFNQIFGHTPDDKIRKLDSSSINYCIDSCMKELLLWEDGKFSIYDNI